MLLAALIRRKDSGGLGRQTENKKQARVVSSKTYVLCRYRK